VLAAADDSRFRVRVRHIDIAGTPSGKHVDASICASRACQMCRARVVLEKGAVNSSANVTTHERSCSGPMSSLEKPA
jgi:hypothetical protein